MNDAASDILGDYYTRAAKRLSELVLHPHGGTDRGRKFTAARAGILAKQADDLGRALKSYTATWTGKELADRVTRGIRAAEQEALVLGVPRPPGAPVTGSFATLDRRAVETLAADTAGTLYRAADSMTERTKSILRQTAQAELSEGDINRILAGGVIDGMPQATWRTLRDALEAAHGGKLVTVIDRNGRPMEFDAGKYARMVAITKTREAVELGRQGRLVELGIELVSIVGRLSKHFCTAFLGQVFFIGAGTHPRYPHLDSLPGGGPPFHPNCSKSTRAYVEGLASDQQQQAAPGVPDAHKLIGMDATTAQRAYQALQLRQQVEPVVRTLTPVAGRRAIVSLQDDVRMLEWQLRELGVKSVDLQQNAVLGALAVQAVQSAISAGLPLPEKLILRDSNRSESAASYNPKTKAVSINTASPYGLNPTAEAVKQHSLGYWSTSRPEHGIVHELAHHAARMRTSEAGFHKLRGAISISDLAAARSVSGRATVTYLEFMAEATAAQIAGVRLHPESIKLLKRLEVIQ